MVSSDAAVVLFSAVVCSFVVSLFTVASAVVCGFVVAPDWLLPPLCLVVVAAELLFFEPPFEEPLLFVVDEEDFELLVVDCDSGFFFDEAVVSGTSP